MDILKALADSGSEEERNDDDVADRLSYRSTTFVLILFTIFAVANPLFAGYISCWCPDEFSPMWVEYANQYCWARGTYDLPFDKEIPARRDLNLDLSNVNGTSTDRRRFVSYYQWVPYMLLALAASSYLPTAVWRTWNTAYGIEVCNVIDSCEKFSQRVDWDPKKPDVHLSYVVMAFQRFLDYGRERYKCSLTLLYAGVKVMFVATAALQLVALRAFLGEGYYGYGYDVIHSLITAGEWTEELPGFPRVTMCDFNVRRLGNVYRYSVQCALTSNLYYEKIFFFIWFWLIAVFAFHVYGAVVWLAQLRSVSARIAYVGNRLNISADLHLLPCFTSYYLRLDGCFLLMLIEHNTDRITVRDILRPLWAAFVTKVNVENSTQRRDSTCSMRRRRRSESRDADNVGDAHEPLMMRRKHMRLPDGKEGDAKRDSNCYSNYKPKSGREIEEPSDSDHVKCHATKPKSSLPLPTILVTPSAPLAAVPEEVN